MACFTDLLLFIVSIIALIIFQLIFFSDLFIDTCLVHFPALLKSDNYSGNSPNILGYTLIITLIVICYVVVYLTLMNI
jgi:hypothetical protein